MCTDKSTFGWTFSCEGSPTAWDWSSNWISPTEVEYCFNKGFILVIVIDMNVWLIDSVDSVILAFSIFSIISMDFIYDYKRKINFLHIYVVKEKKPKQLFQNNRHKYNMPLVWWHATHLPPAYLGQVGFFLKTQTLAPTALFLLFRNHLQSSIVSYNHSSSIHLFQRSSDYRFQCIRCQ